MSEWSGIFKQYLNKKFAEKNSEYILSDYSWIKDIHEKAIALFNSEKLASIEPAELYKSLSELSIPQCRIKVVNLGKANDAARIIASLKALFSIQGDFEKKFKESKFPQAGIVTVSEILCVTKPIRFFIRNTAFTKGLAEVVPFYSAKAVRELSYNDLFDICNELAKVMIGFFNEKGLAEFAAEYKFLLLYAVLTD
ncbi:MAG: hypothetical protein ACYTFY_00660 [Planctomycetota bacterium]|jgi:hypothetical protein